VKHILTQGDLILISYLASLQAQGIYALASNYGGLIARTVFQPIEESSRNYFGKLLSSIDGLPSKDNMVSACKGLHNLLRCYTLLSIFAVALGPTIAPLLLGLVAGPGWIASGAGDVLSKYCYYIPLLAVNGVTEAFISVVATESELNIQSLWMLVFSAGFAAAGYIFLRVFDMGAEGLVWANTVNMAVRIVWSSSFIDDYLKRNNSNLSILEVMPEPATIAVGVVTATVLTQVKSTLTGGVEDFIKCGLVASAFIVVV
jgi:oligosaccharide translocation protein RFT1